MKLRLGIPKGSLQDATVQLFAPRRLQHLRQLAVVLPDHRRSRDRVHADPRAGDGALRRRRRARRRADRPGLDCRAATQRSAARAGRDVRWCSVCDLVYSKQSFGKVRWVLAAPEDSRFKTAAGLRGRDASPPSWSRVTEHYFKRHGRERATSSSRGAPPRSSRRCSPTPSSRPPRPDRRCAPTGCASSTP